MPFFGPEFKNNQHYQQTFNGFLDLLTIDHSRAPYLVTHSGHPLFPRGAMEKNLINHDTIVLPMASYIYPTTVLYMCIIIINF